MIIPQKRAALVLDRLLIALQKALREEEALPDKPRPAAAVAADGPRAAPRAAPLRLASLDTDMVSTEDNHLSTYRVTFRR